MVVHAGHRDFAAEARVLDQPRREHHAALLVEVARRGAGEEMPLQDARVRGERVEPVQPIGHLLPRSAGIGEEAAVQATGHDDALLERCAELRRQREPVLLVQ